MYRKCFPIQVQLIHNKDSKNKQRSINELGLGVLSEGWGKVIDILVHL